MSTKYVDVKITVWERYHFEDDVNINEVIEELKKNPDPNILYEGEWEDPESETIYDTSSFIKPEDNNGDATIEVYDESQGLNTIWTNATRTN